MFTSSSWQLVYYPDSVKKRRNTVKMRSCSQKEVKIKKKITLKKKAPVAGQQQSKPQETVASSDSIKHLTVISTSDDHDKTSKKVRSNFDSGNFQPKHHTARDISKEQADSKKLKNFPRNTKNDKKKFLEDWLAFLGKLKRKSAQAPGQSLHFWCCPKTAVLVLSLEKTNSPFYKSLTETSDFSTIEKPFIGILKLSLGFLIEKLPNREAAKNGTQSSADLMRDTIFQQTLLKIIQALTMTTVFFHGIRMLLPSLRSCMELICEYIAAVPHFCTAEPGEMCVCIDMEPVDREIQDLLLLAIDEAPHLVEPYLGVLWKHYSRAPCLAWILCLRDLYPVYSRNQVSKQFESIIEYLETLYNSDKAVVLNFCFSQEDPPICLRTKLSDYVRVCLTLLIKIADTDPMLFTPHSLDVLELYVLDNEIPNTLIIWKIFEKVALKHPLLFKQRVNQYYSKISAFENEKIKAIQHANALFLNVSLGWNRALSFMCDAMKLPDSDVQVEVIDSWKKFSERHVHLLKPFERDIKKFAEDNLLKSAAEEILLNIQWAKHLQDERAMDLHTKLMPSKQNGPDRELSHFSTSICVIL